MKIYQIAGKQYAVSGDDLYEKLPEFGAIAEATSAIPPLPLRRKYKTRVAKSATPKTGGKGTIRHCKNCGKSGHRSDSCPNRQGTLPPEEEPAKRVEVTKEQVDELRAQGLDSLRIAAKLHTTLTEVNKHW